MHPQTLRMYEQKGLVRPKRTAGNTRLYSEADLERLRLIQRLTTELGLNLAGVEHVLRLEDELAAHAARGSSGSSARCARPSTQVHGSTAASSSSTGHRRMPVEEEHGLQQADDQGPGGGRRQPGAARRRTATPRSTPSTCCWRCSTRSCRRRWPSGPARARRRSRRRPTPTSRAVRAPRARRTCRCAPRPRLRRCSTAPRTRCASSDDEYVSVEHLLLALDVDPARAAAGRARAGARRPARHDARTPRAPTRRSRSSAAT